MMSSSLSKSSTSASSTSETWEGHPIVMGRIEDFRDDTYHHVENRNPYEVISSLTVWLIDHGFFDTERRPLPASVEMINHGVIKLTINGIIVPIWTHSIQQLYDDILTTIENEKHFFKKGDFDIC